MNKDFVWEADYGKRSHLNEVFKTILRDQDALSLQMLAIFVNNVPYNLEFYVAVSYDKPEAGHINQMQNLFRDAGLIFRSDLTLDSLVSAQADRRFDAITFRDEYSVEYIMNTIFNFKETKDLKKASYVMSHFSKDKQVFISHSSKDKSNVEKILPILNGAGLPVWFDKYSIKTGDSISYSIQNGIEHSNCAILWITRNFLESDWCKKETNAFISKSIDEKVLIINILDDDIELSELPPFLRDLKHIRQGKRSSDAIAQEIIPVIKNKFKIQKSY